jgi:aldose 1-epimerase
MPFKVEHSIVNNRSLVHLRNGDIFTATIIPSVGAMLHEMIVPLDGTNYNIIDSYPTVDVSGEAAADWFKGVKLSPWPCRIPDGEYRFDKKNFKLKKTYRDGTALHGLLFDQPFEVVDEFANEETAYLILRHTYQAIDPGYPFFYDCEVKFTIHPGRLLEVESTISNLNDIEIPIADGWHPYFQLGGKVDDWELNFPALSMLEFDSRLVPTGTFVPYDRFNERKKIGNINLDNCFFLKIQEFKPVCSVRNPANKLSLHFFTNPSYSYLQLFIPPHRNSIAIENLSAAPNAFNNLMGLIKLQPGNSRTFRVFYQVEVEENI